MGKSEPDTLYDRLLGNSNLLDDIGRAIIRSMGENMKYEREGDKNRIGLIVKKENKTRKEGEMKRG